MLELSVGAVLKRIRSPPLQIGVISAAVGYLSAFIKNVGTLGIFIPIAIQTARRSDRPRSIYLMPLAFASLVGGTSRRDPARRRAPLRANRRLAALPGRRPGRAGRPTVMNKLVTASGFEIVGSKDLATPEEKTEEMKVVEVIVPADSPLVGATPASLGLRHKYGLDLFSVRRAGTQAATRLRSHRFAAGDVVLFQGWAKNLAASVTELDLLPLADRKLTLGQARSGLVPIGLLLVALVLVGLRLIDVEIAFFGAAVLTVLFKQISLKDTYAAIEWPVIVMLGCLIPVGEALKSTGATDIVADLLSTGAQHLPGDATLGLMLLTAMLLTPFLHHAAAVLVLGPVAAGVATHLGFRIEPF